MKKLLICASLLAGMLTFSACESDRDSNPTLLEPTEFVLNTPALADGVYDLDHTTSIELTCKQPNYGYTAPVTYAVQVSLDDSFEKAETLSTTFNTAKMDVIASELAVTVTNMLVEGGKREVDFPLTTVLKIRLKGELSEGQGTVYSNPIDIKVNLSYSLPPLELPTQMYMIGDFCGWNWDNAYAMVPVNGAACTFWRLAYVPENSGMKINQKTAWNGSEVGFGGITVNDNFNAGIADAGGNIGIAKAGWYIFVVKVEVDGNSYKYTLDVNEPAVYLFGPANGNIWEPKDEWKFSVPTSAADDFISPAFIESVPASSNEGIRACVIIPGFDWWKSEFMVFDGKLEYRGNGGDQARVGGDAGQQLYINFTNGTGEIK